MIEKTRYKTQKMADTVQREQVRLYGISHKLRSFGILLQRQGEEHEGFVELHGLGIALQELGDELYKMWSVLDPGNFTRRPAPDAQNLSTPPTSVQSP